ncbi:DUF4062 domain-containing protein [Tenacibaculum amylolyticum]|uniref:DUF4062 domain-containing protein n=1 Tax=Tenacibaculum amylolyticum TaxID=104269 RepID=UPI0038950519
MSKPVFFISSTIYDMSDLRSSIKWWLEQNNYIVNASDFNDFDKPVDANSYEACLKAIDNSDYFILIIGDRTGGMFDKNTTITQKEYQHAYNRRKLGKIKIINLIRKDTWTNFNQLKSKIKELKNNTEIDKSLVDNLLNEKEKILFNFINEVRRVKEMKEGKLPENNWLHSFDTFKDIVDVLRIELGSKLDLNYKQNRFIAINDIKNNLKKICSKNEGAIYPIAFLSKKLWDNFDFDFDNPNFTFSNDQYLSFGSFYISCLQIKPLVTSRLETLYRTGFFLEYDNNKNDFISGSLNEVAIQLINSYEKINSLHKSLYEKKPNRILELGKKKDNSHLKGTKLEMFFALDFRDSIENCIKLSKSLYNLLMGYDYEVPEIKYINRLPPEMQVKEKNIITDEEILDYLKH